MSLTKGYVIRSNSVDRKENDYYPTPPLAVDCLFHEYNEVIPEKVWEPAAGRGWISWRMENKHKRKVVSTDLFKYDVPLVDIEAGVDYLSESPRANAVITNPPYKNDLARKFVEKAIAESDFTAMFLRLTFMEGLKRYKLFDENPPNVLVFSRRMKCEEENFNSYKGQMGGMVAYAWFIWGKEIKGNYIHWIDPNDLIKSKLPIEGS